MLRTLEPSFSIMFYQALFQFSINLLYTASPSFALWLFIVILRFKEVPEQLFFMDQLVFLILLLPLLGEGAS